MAGLAWLEEQRVGHLTAKRVIISDLFFGLFARDLHGPDLNCGIIRREVLDILVGQGVARSGDFYPTVSGYLISRKNQYRPALSLG
jgi:hypothetical protein